MSEPRRWRLGNAWAAHAVLPSGEPDPDALVTIVEEGVGELVPELGEGRRRDDRLVGMMKLADGLRVVNADEVCRVLVENGVMDGLRPDVSDLDFGSWSS